MKAGAVLRDWRGRVQVALARALLVKPGLLRAHVNWAA
jgi:hypothetical protein